MHDDVAAYVLGVLGREDADAFERHLAGCGRCQQEMGELAAFVPLLRQPEARAALSMSARAPLCKLTRSILLVAAGFVVAIAAVLSVVESLAGYSDEPREVTTVDARGQQALHRHV